MSDYVVATCKKEGASYPKICPIHFIILHWGLYTLPDLPYGVAPYSYGNCMETMRTCEESGVSHQAKGLEELALWK